MKNIKLLFGLVTVGMISSVANAQDPESETRAIEIYQSMFPGVSAEDAAIRVSSDFLQEMRDTQSCLTEIPEFAGMYVNHEPKYEVVARFTKNGNQLLDECTDNAHYTALGANASLNALNDAADAVNATLDGSYFDYGLNVDLEKNKVFVEVEKDNFKLAKSLLKSNVDNSIVKIKIGSSFRQESYATLVAGLNIGGCTSGFNVANAVGLRGMSTAAHCPDYVGLRGQLLFQQNTDLQWHSNAGDVYPARMFNPFNGGSTSVKGTQYSGSLVVNSVVVCKLGPMTGETCGLYKGFQGVTTEDGSGVFPTIDSGSGVMGAKGDSGGPVYHVNSAGLIAFGAVSSGDFGSTLRYTPLEGYDRLGLRILTE